MYIERLTEQDFKEFAGFFNYGVSQIDNVNTPKVHLIMDTGYKGINPQLYLTDFTCATDIAKAHELLENRWRMFMCKKFENEGYKDALRDYFDSLVDNLHA